MIAYKEFDTFEMDDVSAIYKNAGWIAYLQDEDRLVSAFKNSLYVLGAFDQDKMIGFARAVGDGEHVVLLQDLIVMSEYQNQGIGSQLFEMVLDKYKEVRMFMVVTDAEDERSNAFYQRFGMKKLEEYAMTGYIRYC